ncbi:MAG TPA: hypothetical protein VLL52_07560 [Anaerolineae bacterium]|nr:hypothetical protein [Anaerolineae bacterium]
MNIFTRFLSQKHDNNHNLQNFITHWDELEALVIHIYRQKQADTTAQQTYHRLHHWLSQHYDHWRQPLIPHWQASRVGHTPTQQDPFAFIIQHDHADQFVDNWAVMQHLPAAREALNHLILAQEEDS